MEFYTAVQAMHLKREPIGFKIHNIPAQSYIFLHFINPVSIHTGGQDLMTSANACIIFSPGSLLDYKAERINMLHNFLHFDVADPEKFERAGIPINTVFYTNLQNEITDSIELIETCMVKKFKNFPARIDTVISRIFDRIAEEQHNKVMYSGGISIQYRFDELRSLIYQSPKSWSIVEMANYVNLSRSRFSTKYKELFGVTPNEDLTYASILYANKLLTSTDYLISDIAYECGFTSPDYFIRLYKKQTGTTPGLYKKRLREMAKKTEKQ